LVDRWRGQVLRNPGYLSDISRPWRQTPFEFGHYIGSHVCKVCKVMRPLVSVPLFCHGTRSLLSFCLAVIMQDKITRFATLAFAVAIFLAQVAAYLAALANNPELFCSGFFLFPRCAVLPTFLYVLRGTTPSHLVSGGYYALVLVSSRNGRHHRFPLR